MIVFDFKAVDELVDLLVFLSSSYWMRLHHFRLELLLCLAGLVLPFELRVFELQRLDHLLQVSNQLVLANVCVHILVHLGLVLPALHLLATEFLLQARQFCLLLLELRLECPQPIQSRVVPAVLFLDDGTQPHRLFLVLDKLHLELLGL